MGAPSLELLRFILRKGKISHYSVCEASITGSLDLCLLHSPTFRGNKMGDFKLLARRFSLPAIFLHKFFVILGRLPSSLSAYTPNQVVD